MLTPAQVIEELERRGYEMTPRRLVDWRQKGLLPPLAKQGLGQGRGWIYGWDDPLVIEQAIAIEELLALRSRTDWLYLPLWCLGYEISGSRIRPRLLAIVEANLEDIVGDAATPEDVAWRISELSLAQWREQQRQRARHPKYTVEAIEYWLSLLAGSTDYTPNENALATIAESLWRAVGGDQRSRKQDGSWLAEPSDLRGLKRWFARYASLPQLRDTAANVSDEDLRRAQDDWCTLARLARALGQVIDEEARWELYRMGIGVIAVFGPWLTIVGLSLRQNGLASLLDGLREQVEQVERMATRMETDPDIRSWLRDSWHEMELTG